MGFCFGFLINLAFAPLPCLRGCDLRVLFRILDTAIETAIYARYYFFEIVPTMLNLYCCLGH